MHRKVNTKSAKNFNPGLALIDLLGTGPCTVPQSSKFSWQITVGSVFGFDATTVLDPPVGVIIPTLEHKYFKIVLLKFGFSRFHMRIKMPVDYT